MDNEQAQPIHSVMNTTQPDSEPVATEKAKAAANVDKPEDQAPVEATGALSTEQKKEEPGLEQPKPTSEPNIGEKRDIDSTGAPVSEDANKPAIEEPDEPDAKKQKTEPEPAKEPAQEPAKDTNGAAPAPAGDTNGEPEKATRSNKEKVKDAAKKFVPTDGIGSRTRSRTKPT